jgi:excinuclease ABC subunit C
MREMLSYRINSFGKNPPPDLWIIDGGDTLLQLALKLLDDVNIDIDVISISKEKLGLGVRRAKGSARDIIYTKESVFQLKPTDKRLHWVQRQRDEAHRFAVTFHQNRKRKEDLKNSLLEKKGIGLATIKRLLEYFGTFERINSASFDEISVASSKKVAKILKTESVKK